MMATFFSNARDFLTQTQAALETNEAANNLILGLSLRVNHYLPPEQHPPYFAAITANDTLLLAAVMTPPRPLVLYAGQSDWQAPLNLFIRQAALRQWPIAGVTGYPPLSEAFAAAWARLTRTSYRVQIRNRLYELRRVEPTPPTPGRLRLATLADLELVADWTFAFQTEALHRGDSVEALEVTRYKIKDQDLYLWEDGQPVSTASQSRPTRNGICLSLVYTPPEQRGRGYATACVAGLSQLLLDFGCQFCVLFTDLANPTSNHIYQTIGYRPIADFTEYVFNTELHP
ncbi:MAG: GNAT family N-acetyltransferase [Anaerolineales bacterium]|nr:GNAT family N-acetyltransferase [Anaerolineales bacterium]